MGLFADMTLTRCRENDLLTAQVGQPKVCPMTSAGNNRHGRRGNTKPSRYGSDLMAFGSHRVNGSHQIIGEFAHSVLLSTSSLRFAEHINRVADILTVRQEFKIARLRIGFVAIFMVVFHPFRTWPKKGSCNQHVDVDSNTRLGHTAASLVRAQHYSGIFAPCSTVIPSQDATVAQTTNATEITRLKQFVTGDDFPIFHNTVILA